MVWGHRGTPPHNGYRDASWRPRPHHRACHIHLSRLGAARSPHRRQGDWPRRDRPRHRAAARTIWHRARRGCRRTDGAHHRHIPRHRLRDYAQAPPHPRHQRTPRLNQPHTAVAWGRQGPRHRAWHRNLQHPFRQRPCHRRRHPRLHHPLPQPPFPHHPPHHHPHGQIKIC